MTTASFPEAEFIAFTHRLADAAADAVHPHFRSTAMTVENKNAGEGLDPVTIADRAAEQAMRALIAEAYADHGIVGEEFGLERPDAEFVWLLDPIDGTRAFIMGYPLWGTLIALARGDRPLLGMMSQPFTGERYWSEAGAARYRGPGGESILATRKGVSLADAILSTTGPDHLGAGFETERFAAVSAKARLTRFGGDCYAYCQLSAGHIDVIVEAQLQSYDIAALIPIVKNAGGRITSWDGASAAQGGRVVACGDARLHDQVLEILGG